MLPVAVRERREGACPWTITATVRRDMSNNNNNNQAAARSSNNSNSQSQSDPPANAKQPPPSDSHFTRLQDAARQLSKRNQLDASIDQATELSNLLNCARKSIHEELVLF
jgi:hypothetical protein